MSITAPDAREDRLAGPDWTSFADELAPIGEELAARFAREYDETRRRREYDEALATIRRRDEERRLAEDADRAAAWASSSDTASPFAF
ncbi:MAG: hypothetical protein U0S36_01460 [Candidatus Nanopelagicales bacterium]